MRSFTGRAAFDESLPVADGLIEVGFRVDLQTLRIDLEDWLTRKFGGGKKVTLTLTEISSDRSVPPSLNENPKTAKLLGEPLRKRAAPE